MHIDAAYAGSAFICPEFRPLLNGVEVRFSNIRIQNRYKIINNENIACNFNFSFNCLLNSIDHLLIFFVSELIESRCAFFNVFECFQRDVGVMFLFIFPARNVLQF